MIWNLTSFLKNKPSYQYQTIIAWSGYQLKQSKSKLMISRRKHSLGNVRFRTAGSGLGHSSAVSLLVNVKHGKNEINARRM